VKLTDEQWDTMGEFVRNEANAYVGSDETQCRRFVETEIWWTGPSSALLAGWGVLQKTVDKPNQRWDAGGGLSTQLPGSVAGLGHRRRLSLTAGQRQAILKAPDLVVDRAFEHLFADRRAGATACVDERIAGGPQPVIPPDVNAKHPRAYAAWPYRRALCLSVLSAKASIFGAAFRASAHWLVVIGLSCHAPVPSSACLLRSTEPSGRSQTGIEYPAFRARYFSQSKM